MSATKERKQITKGEYERLKEELPKSEKVQAKARALEEAQKELEKSIISLQEQCPHMNTVAIVKYDPYYSGEIDTPRHRVGMNIFQGNFCLDCHYFESRKEGMPWVVCRKCGGDMESRGHFQVFNDGRGHRYKCTDCNHVNEHT